MAYVDHPVVYLDHAATTPLRPEALAAMLPFLGENFGNPSGSHGVARRAKAALEESRDKVAGALGCSPAEVVFTAGGTEADNLALTGTVASSGGRPVCSAVEHHAVLHCTEALGGTVVGVGPDGQVDLDRLAAELDEGVSVVSVMLANNEVGTIQPLAEVVELVRSLAPAAAVHTDAVQAFAWIDVAEAAAGADLVAVSAHKFGGPKGVGALVVRGGRRLAPILHGGGQEAERRSGTHNVAGIVGMAAAVEATVAGRGEVDRRVAGLRDRLTDGLLAAIPGAVETGARAVKIPATCHICVPGVESETLVLLLDEAGVCASAGSACASGAVEPSHVLAAMGVGRDLARGAIRLSLGPSTSGGDVDRALEVVPVAAARLRG